MDKVFPTTSESKLQASHSNLILLVLFLLLSFATLGIGGWLTSLGMGQWYEELRVPPWQPPGWVFSPAWFAILTLLATSTWKLFGIGASKSALVWAISFYAIQLLLNMIWSLLFFTLHSPTYALYEIVLLDLVVTTMVILYSRISLFSSLLLLPYALWLYFATAINTWIVLNN